MFNYKQIICKFAFMVTVTLSIDKSVKIVAKATAKRKNVRGGLSGLVETLLRDYLASENVKIPA